MTTQPYTGVWAPHQFAGKELVNIDFSNRCLVGADFSGAICKDCDFSDSDLSHANFTGADLYRCNFSRSVLYAAEFDNANLTRANFDGSYTYGWLLNTSANVTYARLLQFAVEERRRSVLVSGTRPEYIREVPFGSQIGPTGELCQHNYQVGKYRYLFADPDPQDAALQRSQIYNRLKRLYRENHNGEAALHCLYHERYYLTRSYYRYSPLTGGHFKDELVKTITKTIGSYIAEVTSGYGVRPLRIVRNLTALFLAFMVTSVLVGAYSAGSGVLYNPPVRPAAVGRSTPPALQGASEQPIDLGKPKQRLDKFIQYSLLSMVTPDPQRFTAYGVMVPVSYLYFGASAVLLALLFSSVFVRLLNE